MRFRFLLCALLGTLAILLVAACRPATPVAPTVPPPLPVALLDFWSTQTSVDSREWQFFALQGDSVGIRIASKVALEIRLQRTNSAGQAILLSSGPDMRLDIAESGIYSVFVVMPPSDAQVEYQITLIYTDRDTPTPTNTYTPTLTLTPTDTSSPTLTPTETLTPSQTFSLTPSLTPSRTFSLTPSLTPSDTLTPSRTFTPTLTPSLTKTSSLTPSQTWSLTPSLTRTPSQTWTPSSTLTPTFTPTFTITPSLTYTPSNTNTYTPTPTYTYTYTPTPTYTASLTWTPSNTPTAVWAALGAYLGDLVPGEAVEGRLISSFDRNVYQFVLTSEQYVTLTMTRVTSSIDPTITLFNSAGVPLALDDNALGDGAGGARLFNLPLPAGIYYVQAYSKSDPGDYLLTLTTSDTPIQAALIAPQTVMTPAPTLPSGTSTPLPANPNGQLEDRAPMNGQIARAGEINRYFVRATAGDVLTIIVSPDDGSSIALRAELFTPSGELLFTADARRDTAGDALIPAIRVLESGAFAVYVSGLNRSTGNYTIAFGVGAAALDVPRGVAVPYLSYTGAVLKRGVADLWAITLQAGQTVDAQVNTRTSLLDPALELIASDGRVLAYDADALDGINPLLNRVVAPTSGQYFLRVTADNGDGLGEYLLSWRPRDDEAADGTLLLSARDRIAAQTYLRYPFYGIAGQIVRIAAVAVEGDLDPVAAVLDGDGNLVVEADDGTDSLSPTFTVTLPQTGTYMLRLNGYGTTSGTIEVAITEVVEIEAEATSEAE